MRVKHIIEVFYILLSLSYPGRPMRPNVTGGQKLTGYERALLKTGWVRLFTKTQTDNKHIKCHFVKKVKRSPLLQIAVTVECGFKKASPTTHKQPAHWPPHLTSPL